MSDNKYVVPEGMLKATLGPLADLQMGSVLQKNLEVYLQRAICWQDGELAKMQAEVTLGYKGAVIFSAIEDVRRMFLDPATEMIGDETVAEFCSRFRTIGEASIEAFRCGQNSTK
jgi:hypothetical protein